MCIRDRPHLCASFTPLALSHRSSHRRTSLPSSCMCVHVSERECVLCGCLVWVWVFSGRVGFCAGVCVQEPTATNTGAALLCVQIGDTIKVIGPQGAFEYKGYGEYASDYGDIIGKCSKIGFVCGGSGITPAFQVIQAVLANATEATSMWLVYANQVRDEDEGKGRGERRREEERGGERRRRRGAGEQQRGSREAMGKRRRGRG
eukprot:3407892-Rhodomonas_salina.1